jgi:hypothetical protein
MMIRPVLISWLALLPGAALAQTTSFDCIPPAMPATGYDAALIREYRQEIGAEFSDYFTAAGRYIRCLEAARMTAEAEVREVIEEYNRVVSVRE